MRPRTLLFDADMPSSRSRSRDPEALLPLTPAIFHIMLALADGPSHGYAIVQEVGALTNGRLMIGEGTLYRSTERMLEEGFIAEVAPGERRESADARRRTYRLTPWGRTVARAEGARVAALADVVTARGLVQAAKRRRNT